VQDPPNPLLWGFVCQKEHELWEEARFPTWVTQLINATAALAGDGSPD